MAAQRKLCGHCDKPLDNHRRTYHVECLSAVKAAAQLARRRCSRCRKTKAASKFSNDATRADGKFPWCIECQLDGKAAQRFQDSGAELNGHVCPMCDTPVRGHRNRRFCSAKCKDRVAALKKRFGLSVEQYRALVAATGGRCPICACTPRMWHVDHDHRTSLVTGVVCQGCNVGPLAASQHKVERVQALLAYLEHTPAAQLGIEAYAPEEASRTPNLQGIWGYGKKEAS
jgi:hypothetical protein